MGDPPAHPANGCPPSPPSNPTRQHRPAFWGPSPPWQHSAGSPPVAPLALCSLTESAVREGCPRPGLCRGEGGATSYLASYNIPLGPKAEHKADI